MPAKIRPRKFTCITHPQYNLKKAPEGASRTCTQCTRNWNQVNTGRRKTLVRNRCRRDGQCRACGRLHVKVLEDGKCLSCVFLIDNIDSFSESRNGIRQNMQEYGVPLAWTNNLQKV